MENHVGSNGVISQDEIPAVVKDVLPADPFDLLNLSRLIAAQAFTARIHTLEAEAGKLKGSLGESQSSINALEAKVADLELTLKEANEKREAAEEEQAKLTGEKTALVAMVKKLNRDVAKLETFRRTLMQQLKDENDDEPASEVGMAESASGRKPPVPESSVTSESSASTTKTQTDVSVSLAAGVAGPGAGTALRVDHVARSTAAAGSATVASTMDHAGPGEDAARSNITTTGQAAASTTGSSSSVSASLRNLRTPQRTPSMTPSLFSPAFTPSATPPHGSTAASPRSRTEGENGSVWCEYVSSPPRSSPPPSRPLPTAPLLPLPALALKVRMRVGRGGVCASLAFTPSATPPHGSTAASPRSRSEAFTPSATPPHGSTGASPRSRTEGEHRNGNGEMGRESKGFCLCPCHPSLHPSMTPWLFSPAFTPSATPSHGSTAASPRSRTEGESLGKAEYRPLPLPQRTPSMTPSLFSPAFTPSATPPHGSTAASPRSRTEAFTTPSSTPTVALLPHLPLLPLSLPLSSPLPQPPFSPPLSRSLSPSHQLELPGSSSPARAPRVDGKEFFRRARNRLSYEQFSLFLANIKELNAHRKTREETLKKAEIFGTENKDLYASFETLLLFLTYLPLLPLPPVSYVSVCPAPTTHCSYEQETLKKAEEIFGTENKDLYASFETLLSRHLPT
ncbi:unnamed protein product [Closterium sp. NIES-65]|nr:unnamed protein product [Closterium sp. NIES-65]